MRLKGKIAVVTGAGYGIGRGIALRLAQEGASVTVSFGHSELDARASAQEIEKIGGKALLIKTDVRVSAEIDHMMEATVRQFGGLDILVNNAGVADQSRLLDLEEETWDRVLDINLKGSYLCCRAGARIMVKQGNGGRIIQIGSVNATRSVPGRCHYAASKAGLVAMNKVIACELAEHGITCNVVSPGVTYSRMTESMLLDSDKVRTRTLPSIPLHRIGTPEDIAGMVVFLCTEEAAYITGVNIDVDGGLVPSPIWDNV